MLGSSRDKRYCRATHFTQTGRGPRRRSCRRSKALGYISGQTLQRLIVLTHWGIETRAKGDAAATSVNDVGITMTESCAANPDQGTASALLPQLIHEPKTSVQPWLDLVLISVRFQLSQTPCISFHQWKPSLRG